MEGRSVKALTTEREANDSGNGGIVLKQETGSALPNDRERAEGKLRLLYSSRNPQRVTGNIGRNQSLLLKID